MTSLLILGSCQELQEIPMVQEESLEIKFDRLRFLGAVTSASLKYSTSLSNHHGTKYLRTIYDTDVVIRDYIENIIEGYNTPDQWYQTIPESSWNDPYHGQIFPNEITLDKSTLSPRVRMHVDNYENAINNIADQYESDAISDDQAINQIKSITKSRGNLIKSDGNISLEERGDLSDIFYLMDEVSNDLLLVLEDPSFEMGRLMNKRWFRAFVRVVLVAAVTAAVIYTGAAALSFAKIGWAGTAHKAGWAAVTKKVSIGASGKLYPGLTFGLGKGLINATQKWDDDWEGIVKEAKYSVKVAW